MATSTETVDFGSYSAGPQLQQASVSISLQDSNYNTVAYNKYVIAGATTGGIPGYEPILIIGIFCVISIIGIKKRLQ